jgi:thioredoxin reductase (NADPH)
MNQTDKNEIFDVIILGAGPAGFAAGIYAKRAELNVLLIDAMGGGGQMALTDTVENYPGQKKAVAGYELADTMREQLATFGGEITFDRIDDVQAFDDVLVLKSSQQEYRTRTLIVATGAKHRELQVPGEERLKGHGVSYCATCDGAFYKGKHVAVVGGGDTAVKEAVFLSRIVDKVSVIHRRDKLRAEKIIQQKAHAAENLDFHWFQVVEEVQGDEKVRSIQIRNVQDQSTSRLEVDGVFVFVGILPNSDAFKDLLELDAGGFIKTDITMRTSHPRIWATGDVRAQSVRQIASAVGDGVTAFLNVQGFLDTDTPARELP